MSPVKRSEPPKLQNESRRFAVEELLGAARQAVIVHNGREYKLRLTQNGKLILTA